MFVPAQHQPVSLIGLIWVLGSCWSSVEKSGREGYSEEEAGVLWQQRDFLGLQNHNVTAENVYRHPHNYNPGQSLHVWLRKQAKMGKRKERVK